MIMFSVTLFALTEICVLQAFVMLNPQKAEVLEGESVLLTCSSEINRSISHWTWSSYDQHFNLRLHPHKDGECNDAIDSENTIFYSVYCNRSSTSILLRNVTRNRHGERWECDSDFERSNSAIFYVIVPVTSVQIDSAENIISPIENTEVHLSCSTSFARPAPNITWYLTEKMSGREGQIQLLVDNIVQITNNTNDLFSTKSEILLYVNRSFDGRRVHCLANNHPGITVSSAKIFVDVQYIVSFFVKGFEGEDIITVLENDTVQFKCLIDTVASNARLTFHWNKVLFEGFDTPNLTYSIGHVSCRDTGDYTCVGTKALNNGELLIGHLTLLVKCPPHPNTPIQENVQAKPGDIVTISLDIIAYPEPRLSAFVWMKLTNANWTIINNSLHREVTVRRLQSNLTIKSVTEEDYGKYQLTVTNGLGTYSQNFYLTNADADELSDNNVIAIASGSVVGSVVLVGIFIVAIFLARNAKHKSECPCISVILKCKGGKETSTIPSTSSSAAAESNENPSSSKPKNIYEQLQRNGEVEKEYQEIQLGEDDKCVYKNIQLHPPPATS